MSNTNGRASTTNKIDVAGKTGYLDAKYDTSGEPLLPDLTDPKSQDEALDMLLSLQVCEDLNESRMLAAIHNLLYDQWADATPDVETQVLRDEGWIA